MKSHWVGQNRRIKVEGYKIAITRQYIEMYYFGREILWQNEESFLSHGNEFMKQNQNENSIWFNIKDGYIDHIEVSKDDSKSWGSGVKWIRDTRW